MMVDALALSNDLILEEIFQNFSSTDLLQLSLVNKQWNHVARSLMIKRGDLAAHIHKNRTCEDLRDFACHLRRINEMNKCIQPSGTKKILPFSGMTVALQGCGHKDWCHKSPTGELDEDYENIVGQMTWKYLAVSFNSNWDECENCFAYLLMDKIFKKSCCTLEKLSLQVEYNQDDLLEPVLSGCNFPNLKTFRLQKPRNSILLLGATREGDTKLIKKIMSTAPNLQVLDTEDCVDLKANLLKLSSAVHVTDYEDYFSYLQEIPESGVVDLRMRRMRFDSVLPQFNPESFNRMASTLLQNSRTTLSSMEIAAIFLVPLARYGVCFQNVRRLGLKFSDAILEREPSLWRLLKSFDFKRIFPNLSTVQILRMFNGDFENILNAFSNMIEEENATFSDPVLDRAANIKNVSLQWPIDILVDPSEFLIQMFPDMKKVTIRAKETIPLTRIWDYWRNLEELDITLLGYRILEQLGSEVCGLFPAEVAMLQKQDEEFLRKVNIVPVMPSITCLKSLRAFNLSFEELFSIKVRSEDPTLVFSKVAGLVAFQRCPALTVTLKRVVKGIN